MLECRRDAKAPAHERIPYRRLRVPVLLQLLDVLREGRQGPHPIDGLIRLKKERLAPREPLRPQIHQPQRQRPVPVFISRVTHQGLVRDASIN